MSDLGQQLKAAAVTAADAPAGVDVVLLADALRIAALSVAPAPVAAKSMPDMRLNENEQIAEDFAAAATEEFERIFGSGPLKMDLRKCPFLSEIHEGHKVYQGQYLSRDTRLMHSAYQAGATSPVLARLAAVPPVQEGPKGVGADAKLEELLFDFAIEAHRIHPHVFFNGTKVGPKASALRQHFKQCTAQSIPAAIDEEGMVKLPKAFAGVLLDRLRKAQMFKEADELNAALERLLSGN